MRSRFSDFLDSIECLYDKADIVEMRRILFQFRDEMKQKSKEELLAFLPELTYLSPFHKAFAPLSKII